MKCFISCDGLKGNACNGYFLRWFEGKCMQCLFLAIVRREMHAIVISCDGLTGNACNGYVNNSIRSDALRHRLPLSSGCFSFGFLKAVLHERFLLKNTFLLFYISFFRLHGYQEGKAPATI